MVRGNTGLERCKDENLLLRTDLEDAPAAISHIKIASAIECDASRDTHAFQIKRDVAGGVNGINAAVVPARNEKVAGDVEGQTRRIHDFGREGSDGALGRHFVDGNGRLLPAPVAIGDVDIALSVDRGIADRVDVCRQALAHFILKRFAGASILCDAQIRGSGLPRRFRYFNNDLFTGCRGNLARKIAEPDLRYGSSLESDPRAMDCHFAARQGRTRRDVSDNDFFHVLNAESLPKQSERCQCVEPGADIIGDHTGTARQAFQMAYRKRLHDIENPK